MPPVSPINATHLTVNPVPTSSRMGYERPFIFDRGTQTIHMGHPGGGHVEVRRAVGLDGFQGPVYHGCLYPDNGVEWYGAPNANERGAVARVLGRHLDSPTYDRGELWEEDPQEFKVGSVLTCPTCGDLINSPDCPRCDWGTWNHSEDNTQNPRDPTIDMHRGIQSNQFARVIPSDRWFWRISLARKPPQEPYWDF